MNGPHCIVAVDVGNSAAKLWVRKFASGRWQDLAPSSFPMEDSDWTGHAIRWFEETRASALAHPVSTSDGATKSQPKSQWRIASVRSPASHSLCDALAEHAERSEESIDIKRIGHDDIPLQTSVDDRSKLGVDRLLGAFAASRLFDTPRVVVDAGSAITVDWVDAEDRFRGGAILPGLRMQLRALARGTEALPEVELALANSTAEFDEDTILPATNTADAIRLGVLVGIGASIGRLASGYQSNHARQTSENTAPQSGNSSIIMTGGDAESISPFLSNSYRIVPYLVCRGLLELSL